MSYAGGTRTVDVHVAQLRRKLGRPGRDPDGPRRRLQGRPAVRLASLRARLFAAIALVALLSLALALAIGAVLTRRAVERNTLRDVSAQFDLLVERERNALLPFSRLRSLQEFLDRQDERVIQVPLDGSSTLLPPGARGAAAPRREARRDARHRRHALPLRRPARERQGLHAAAAGQLDDTRPGGRTSTACSSPPPRRPRSPR